MPSDPGTLGIRNEIEHIKNQIRRRDTDSDGEIKTYN